MNILTIPLCCARQKWPRAVALLCVFMLGVASMMALYKVSGSVGEGFEKKLTAFGANIVISPLRETLTVSYGGIPLGDMLVDEGRLPLASSVTSILGIPLRDRLAVVAPKLVGIVRYDGKAMALVGVDFYQELELKRFWSVRGDFPAEAEAEQSMGAGGGISASGFVSTGKEADMAAPLPGSHQALKERAQERTFPKRAGGREALAGEALAARLGLNPGDALRLGSGPEAVDLAISGVLHPTGSDDDNVLFVPIEVAQRLLHAGNFASFIEVAALCSGCPIEDIVGELRVALPGVEVKALRQVVEQRMYAVNFAQHLTFIVVLVIMSSGCAMVCVSMLSAVHERKKEIGLMRAVGYSRGAVFFIFAAEAMGLGGLAGLAGYGLGFEASKYILSSLSFEAAIFPLFSLLEMLACGAVAGLMAVLAATVPALKAGRVDPATALASL